MAEVNGEYQLIYVKLKEEIEKSKDVFKSNIKDQYRVLRLEPEYGYYQELYNDKDELIEIYEIKNYEGNKFDYIPFFMIGAENNRIEYNKPPLLDIAFINLGHYRNSADFEDNLHVHSQGTLIIKTEMSKEQFDSFNPNGIEVGSRSAHNLGANSDAKLLQLNPSQVSQNAMDNKVRQMIGLGARFIEGPKGNQVVESVRVEKVQKESGLSTAISNCSKGILNCLHSIIDFMSGDKDKVVFEINMDFFDKGMSAQEISASIMLVDSGVIAKTDLRDYLKQTGILSPERTNEEIDNEVEIGIIDVE